MSVSKALEGYYKDREHPHQQLLKNILVRLDAIQHRQSRPFTSTSNHEKVSVEEVDKIKVNMKIVLNSSIENLKRLEDSTRENWEQMADKLRALETKMFRIFKEKQEAMEFLDLRIISIENSQKNVTEYMKKVAEQQNLKYSGVPLIEDRIKQIQHIFQLKDKKQSQNLRIMEEHSKLSTERKFKQLEAKLNQTIENQPKEQSPESNFEQKLEEIANKLKFFDLENKQLKRKLSKLEQNLKQAEEEISALSKKTDTLQKQMKDFEKSQIAPSISQKNMGFKTQNAEKNQKKMQTGGYLNAAKKTEPNYLKPEPPSINRNNQVQSKKNPYDLLNNKNRLESNDGFDRNKKTNYRQEEDQDPFQSMGAGIRGLLRKSKEKDDKKPVPNRELQSNRKPLPRQTRIQQLSRQPSPRGALRNRNLPPVRPDQKIQNRFSNKNSQVTSEEDEQVYQVDQQGYLIDEDGNYLYNEDGDRIQLSQEQMNNLMEQN